MKTNQTLIEESNRLNESLRAIATARQQIEAELSSRVPSLRTRCGFDRTSTANQIAWLCLEVQIVTVDRVILLEELASRQSTIEQFLIALQNAPTPTISAALAGLAAKNGSVGSGQASDQSLN